MGHRVIRVASRSSPLARIQTDEALSLLRPVLPVEWTIEISYLSSPGDRDKLTSLGSADVPDDFFTRDIDEALLVNRADLAVHSAKDLPKTITAGLAVACLLPGRDNRDALVLRKGLKAGEPLKRIGTSSPRREEAIRALFSGAETKALRGTIEERLDKLDHGEYDAIIVAACALERLSLAARISSYLPYETAPLQGRLALVTRAEDRELSGRLLTLDFRQTLFARLEPAYPIPQLKEGESATLFLGLNPDRFPQFKPILHWPIIRLFPRPLEQRMEAFDQNIPECDGIFFASPFAVRCLVEAAVAKQDDRRLRAKKLLAVGPSTAREIEQMGLQPSLAADDFGGIESLASKVDTTWGGVYFYPCSDQAPTEKRMARLRDYGIRLHPVVYYENRATQPQPLPSLAFHRIVFTSPSTVQAFFSRYPEEQQAKRQWLAIGSSTLEALQQRGLKGQLIHER